MATRRNRIKGIANIPIRKKVDAEPSQSDLKVISAENEVKDTIKSVQNHSNAKQTPILSYSDKIETNKTDIQATAIEENVKNDVEGNDKVIEKSVTENKIHVLNVHTLKSYVTSNEQSSLNETKLSNQNIDKKKPIESPNVTVIAQNEYPVPPVSPFKANRSRIKGIPKLGIRHISLSASESEDESKKNDKLKNETQTLSTPNNDMVPSDSPVVKSRDFNSVIQRKCKRTDQSRKLAEARREFSRRWLSSGQPDRKKLTMMDLIFYNPTTNLMSSNTKKNSETNAEDGQSNESEDNEEKPTENETSKNDDEENDDVPVPQIKIGPSGEIVIDEKSLMIENKQLKKDRAVLEKSKVIDGNSEQKYGIYKRTKRAKDWTHDETLFFYKALNTLGTDFSSMCQLFPKRSRRELKTKFKKEERINRALIDRAILEPCHYDYFILKKEQEIAQREQETLEKMREDNSKNKEGKRGCYVSSLIQKENMGSKVPKDMKYKKRQPEADGTYKMELKKNKDLSDSDSKGQKRKNQFELESETLSGEDTDESNLSENLSEVLNRPVRTRSGRLTKTPQIFDPNPVFPESLPPDFQVKRMKIDLEKTRNEPALPTPSENKDAEDTGSIMVVSKSDSEGKSVYEVYMVTKGLQSDNNENRVLKKLITISANEENPILEKLAKESTEISAEQFFLQTDITPMVEETNNDEHTSINIENEVVKENSVDENICILTENVEDAPRIIASHEDNITIEEVANEITTKN